MSFQLSPNTQNIRLGTCSIRYKGVDLGYTMGGVEVEVTTTTHETKIDQFGDVVANEFIQGRNIMVSAPLAETTLDNMIKLMPGAAFVAEGGGQSTGTITVAANPADAETVTVNGQAITFKTTGAIAFNSEVNIGADTTITASNLATLINLGSDNDFGNLGAVSAINVVTITYALYSAAGNSVGLIDGTTGDLTLSGATLTGGSAPTKQRVEVSTGVGVSLLDIAGELTLHPIANAANDLTEDLVIPRAATPGGMSFSYKFDEERVFNAEFKGYPDAAGVIFIYGDKTATA